MQIQPVIVPQIDTHSILRLGSELLRRNIAEHADCQNVSPHTVEGFLLMADAIRHSKKPEVDFYRNGSHLVYGFLVDAEYDTLIDAAACTDLTWSVGDPVALVSGNLNQWRVAVIYALMSKQPDGIYSMFNNLMLFFEHLGYSMWPEYRKIQHHSYYRLEIAR
jgi:hypothetical protein